MLAGDTPHVSCIAGAQWKKDQVPTERVKIGLLVDVRLIIYLTCLEGFTSNHAFVLITAIKTSVATVSKRAGVHNCPSLTVCFVASLLAQMVKNLPAMQETQVRSLG